jgi:hypothetical protein
VEAARIRYQYRKLIVSGSLRVDRRAATPLVGPDCAYHLYAWEGTGQGARPERAAERRSPH